MKLTHIIVTLDRAVGHFPQNFITWIQAISINTALGGLTIDAKFPKFIGIWMNAIDTRNKIAIGCDKSRREVETIRQISLSISHSQTDGHLWNPWRFGQNFV